MSFLFQTSNILTGKWQTKEKDKKIEILTKDNVGIATLIWAMEGTRGAGMVGNEILKDIIYQPKKNSYSCNIVTPRGEMSAVITVYSDSTMFELESDRGKQTWIRIKE